MILITVRQRLMLPYCNRLELLATLPIELFDPFLFLFLFLLFAVVFSLLKPRTRIYRTENIA